MIKSINGVRLVPFEPEAHTMPAYVWQNSSEYGEFFRAMPIPQSLRGVAAAMEGRSLMIVLESENGLQIAGAIMHFNQDETARSFEVAILIDKQFQNSRIAFTALKMFLNWKFNTCNLYRAEFMVLERNKRLCAALDKFGAKQEGVLKKKAFIDGEFLNVAAFAILKTDFNKFYQKEFKSDGPRLEARMKDVEHGEEIGATIQAIPRPAVRSAGSAS